MPSQNQLETSRIYADLMEEAKVRLACMEAALTGRSGLPGPIVQEFCFLQLRMLCELIALGCLVAHGDIRATTSLRKEWSAEKIIGAMEKLHPDFYPSPRIPKRTGPNSMHFDDFSGEYLTKAEFIKLVGKCGGALHRGSLKKLLSSKMPIQTNFPELVKWGQKIIALLNVHLMLLQDKKTTIICLMKNRDNNDLVQVAIAEAP
jgi:hypothetical protein